MQRKPLIEKQHAFICYFENLRPIFKFKLKIFNCVTQRDPYYIIIYNNTIFIQIKTISFVHPNHRFTNHSLNSIQIFHPTFSFKPHNTENNNNGGGKRTSFEPRFVEIIIIILKKILYEISLKNSSFPRKKQPSYGVCFLCFENSSSFCFAHKSSKKIYIRLERISLRNNKYREFRSRRSRHRT